MKRKILLALLIAVCSCFVVLGIAACGNNSTHTEHTWDEGVITQAATCTEDGIMTYTCTECGETKTETINAMGHSYTSEVTTPATCTAAGERTYTCSVCGDTYTEEIDATGHSYTSEITTAATCTAAGERTYTCSACGDTYTEEIAATGHSYTSTVTTPATCTTAGERTYTCSVCGDTYTEEIAATGHSYGEWEITVEPTSDTEGQATRECSVCGEKELKTIEAHTHSATGDGTILSHATTTDGSTVTYGTIQYTCTTCGFKYTETYVEKVIAVIGGDENSPAAITTMDYFYVVYVSAEQKENEMTSTEDEPDYYYAPAERYFMITCNESDGATYTITLLYSDKVCAVDPNQNQEYLEGDGASWTVILDYGETFTFYITATDFTVDDEDWYTSFMFLIEQGTAPEIGSQYHPDTLNDGTNTATGTYYFKYSSDNLDYNYFTLTFGEGVSVYFSTNLDSEGESVSSGDYLPVYIYTYYLKVIVSSGSATITVAEYKMPGSSSNPYELTKNKTETAEISVGGTSDVWYSYVATSDDVDVVLTMTDDGSSSVRFTVYAEDKTTVVASSSSSKLRLTSLANGTTYYIKVTNSSQEASEFILRNFESSIDAGYVVSSPIDANESTYTVDAVGDGTYMYYVYTAISYGTFKISKSGLDNISLYSNSGYSIYWASDSGTWSVSYSCNMSTDDIIYIKVNTLYSGTFTITFTESDTVKYTVTVKNSDSTTSTIVSGITVKLINGDIVVASADTDSNGIATFSSVHPWTYTVVLDGYGEDYSYNAATTEYSASGCNTDIELEKAYTYTVKLVLPDGSTGVTSATVSITVNGKEVAFNESGNGVYTSESKVLLGTYQVSVSLSESYANYTVESTNTSADSTDLTITLIAILEYTVNLVDSANNSLGAGIKVDLLDGSSAVVGTGTTDENGSVTIKCVSATYTISVSGYIVASGGTVSADSVNTTAICVSDVAVTGGSSSSLTALSGSSLLSTTTNQTDNYYSYTATATGTYTITIIGTSLTAVFMQFSSGTITVINRGGISPGASTVGAETKSVSVGSTTSQSTRYISVTLALTEGSTISFAVGYYEDGAENATYESTAVVTIVYSETEEPETYTVTFHTEHGTAPATQTVESGSTAGEPEELTCDGYTFGGWYTDEDCTEEFDFDTAITEDITLYAKWTEEEASEPTGATVNDPLSLNDLLEDGVGTATVTTGTYYIYTATGNGTVTVSMSGTIYAVGSTTSSSTVRGSTTVEVEEGDTFIVCAGGGTTIQISFTPSEDEEP